MSHLLPPLIAFVAASERNATQVDVFQDAALQWLDSRNRSAPFFLYLSFTVPHAGGWGDAPQAPEQGAPVPSDKPYRQHHHWPNVERDHAAVVTYLDSAVGDLIAKLKALGVQARKD